MDQELTQPASAVRGRVLTFTREPDGPADHTSYRYLEDGIVVADGCRIIRVDDAQTVLKELPAATTIDHFPTCLITPGLIDLHIHFPQTQVIASYGTRLLEWLERYTFV